MDQLTCHVCGKAFMPAEKRRRATAKYCSMACFNTARAHKPCSVSGCPNKALAKGLCDNHYRQMRRETMPGEQGNRRLSEKKWKEHNKPRVRAYQAMENRRPKTRFRKAKWEASRRGITWTLTWEEFLSFLDRPCTYCGERIDAGGSGLDRVDSTQGYGVENVVPCCQECNRIKANRYTAAETMVMIQALLAFRRGQHDRAEHAGANSPDPH